MFKRSTAWWMGVSFSTLVLLVGCKRPEPDVLDVDWRRTYTGKGGAHCGGVLRAEDGGCFLVGTTNMQYAPVRRGDIYLIRTDEAGAVQWEKTYGGEFYEWGSTMVRTSAGELAIAGQIKSPQTQGIDACLLKVDQKGKQLWFRSFPGPLDEMTMWVDEAADGGFVLIGNLVDPNAPIADSGAAGYIGYDGRSSICLIRTDRDGQELWRRTYDRGQNMITTSGLPTPDGGTLILATIMYFPQPDNDICLFKVDATGTELWSRTWSEGQRYGSRLICCADGNYLITGSYLPGQVTDASQMDLLFIKTDPAGETIWERILGDPRRADKGSVLAQTADGGYVAAGDRTRDLFARDGHNSLVKIDGEGQLVWRQNWPAKHTMYSALFQHEDGGYVIAGSTTVDDVGCMVLIKTKPEGAHEGR